MPCAYTHVHGIPQNQACRMGKMTHSPTLSCTRQANLCGGTAQHAHPSFRNGAIAIRDGALAIYNIILMLRDRERERDLGLIHTLPHGLKHRTNNHASRSAESSVWCGRGREPLRDSTAYKAGKTADTGAGSRGPCVKIGNEGRARLEEKITAQEQGLLHLQVVHL